MGIIGVPGPPWMNRMTGLSRCRPLMETHCCVSSMATCSRLSMPSGVWMRRSSASRAVMASRRGTGLAWEAGAGACEGDGWPAEGWAEAGSDRAEARNRGSSVWRMGRTIRRIPAGPAPPDA